MRCLHHLRAASGERSNLHVGLAATTPLSEEETYRKVCRMGRDAPFLSEDEQRSSPPGSHPWPSFLTRAYGTLPTSLFFSSPNASMLAHVALPSCQPEGGYWASGERSSFHGTGAVWKEQRVWWGASAWLYLLLLGYIAICLYIYIGIVLFFYCFIACLQHGSITFFISIFYFCSLLRPLFFMIVVAVSLSFCFLRCKGMAVLSDTKHQAMPYSAKTFSERLPQMLHIWVSQKTFYRIVGCSDSKEPPSLNARKKAIWWRDDGMIKKISDRKEQKTVKGNESSNPE